MAPPDASPMTAAPIAAGAPFGAGVTLGTRIEMYPAAPLPDFNAAGGPAFAARYKGDAGSELMAILCNGHLPPRQDAIAAMRNIDHPSIVRLVDGSVVVWPNDGARYFALAYHRPAAARFKQSVDEPHAPMGEDNINHHFLTPMIGALNELLRTGTVHNGIRPTNIFWRPGGAPPQLGECLSTPGGFAQPALFETLERAMAAPAGRGTGIHTDDCYAFGVTMALMILGHNPLRGLDDRGVIQAKIERGTFNALVGNVRLTGSHSELLRGLLTDDARQRWTATELEQWLGGRRLTPKNTDAGRRSSRGLAFGGKEYWQVRPLAEALAAQPSEAARMIENGSLDKWLRRSLGDEERAESVDDAKDGLRDQSKMLRYEDVLVSRVCIALDPAAPIRYRGISVMPAGIGTMIADAILTGGSVQGLSEIISNQLVTFWVNMQREMKTNLVPLGQQFERVRALLEKTTFGNGIERVVYELEPGLACISPMLRAQYVASPKMMLPALERVAGLPNRAREPMDRHIAAFLIVREKRSEALFESMAAPETSPRRGIALLNLFSEMQYRYGPETLPNLAQWLMPLIDVSVRRYLGKAQREGVQKQVREAATRGNLGTLLRLIDDPDRVERDRQQFLAARLLYLSTLKEITVLEARLANRDDVVHTEGKPIAASVSGFLAVILGLLAVLRVLWQNMI